MSSHYLCTTPRVQTPPLEHAILIVILVITIVLLLSVEFILRTKLREAMRQPIN